MTSTTRPAATLSAADYFHQLLAYAAFTAGATHRFQVGDVPIDLTANTPELAARLLRPLSHLHQTTDAPRIRIRLVSADREPPPFPWPDAGELGGLREWADGGYRFSQYGGVAVVGFEVATGRAVGYVRMPEQLPAAFFSGLLFTTIYQGLRAFDYFLLHAAALSWQGAGVLITGPSGAGKTTTMLQCVRAGFQFVADDATLLHLQSDGQVRAVSTLNTMHVTRQTSALFPELAVPVQDQRGDKTTLFLPEIYPQAMASSAMVRLLLVPSLHGPRDGSLEPLSARAVLADALPLSVDLSQPEAATAHLDLLFHLVSTVRSYHLHLPPEIGAAPELIKAAIQRHDENSAA